jgi:hypothetical protein
MKKKGSKGGQFMNISLLYLVMNKNYKDDRTNELSTSALYSGTKRLS